jgi:hypothetical protein
MLLAVQFPVRSYSVAICRAERRSILTPNTKERRQLTSEEKELLAQFARFEIGLEELTIRLRGMLELDFGPEKRKLVSYFLLPEPGVRIELSHAKNAMEKHWRGEVSDDELYRWATMLLLNEAYDWQGPEEDEIAEMLNELAILPKPQGE